MNLQEYVDKKQFIPNTLDTKAKQEAFFKTLEPIKVKHEMYNVPTEDIQAYIMDSFLPLLAKSGYVLQKCRVRQENRVKFVEEGLYLPDFLQDFHDQKDFFKFFSTKVDAVNVPWIKAQCYIIDLFLWKCMVQHNFKLQKSRKRLEFEDIQLEIYEYERTVAKQRAGILTTIFSEMKAKGIAK